MNKSVKKNYIFNLIYQIFLIIIPIITTPYVSRVLLSDGVGKYSFSLSIVNYFILLASFGFASYGQREIAKESNNKYQQSKVFWEIFVLKNITSLISLLAYIGLILSGVLAQYNSLLVILALSIVSVGLDSSYLLQGNEDFKKTVSANFVIRVLGIICTFIFVKNPSHIWIYALISVAGGILSNIIMWIYSSKYLVKVNVRQLSIKKHFIPALRLFIPTIAVSVYTLLDRTLIGLLLEDSIADSAVGFYDSAEKIVKMALTVVTALGTVMIPNNARYYAQKNYTKVNQNIEIAIKFTACLGFPMMFGLSAISANMVPWFFGPGYEPCVQLLVILSSLVIVIGLSGVFGTQYLVPTNKENVLTISVVAGAIVNLTLNLLMIPKLGALGAAIATIISETIVTIIQMAYLRKIFPIRKVLKILIKYAIAGLVMYIAVKGVSLYLDSSIINSVLLVLIGAIVYFSILLLFRDELLLQTVKHILNKLKKKKGGDSGRDESNVQHDQEIVQIEQQAVLDMTNQSEIDEPTDNFEGN